jgi:hypothetical protein
MRMAARVARGMPARMTSGMTVRMPARVALLVLSV